MHSEFFYPNIMFSDFGISWGGEMGQDYKWVTNKNLRICQAVWLVLQSPR